MLTIPGNKVLKVPSEAINEIRKIHNLDKPGRIEQAVNILEEWILKQDHIIKKDYSKVYLDKTLISCKGSVEKAKKQIDRLCTMKTLLPKFFSKTNVHELDLFLKLGLMVHLPTLTDDYYRIAMIRVGNKDIQAECFMQFYQYIVILTEYIKAHDYANGFIIIYDLRLVNIIDLVSKLNTVELQQIMTILIEGYGARLKGIHIVTDSKAVELIINIVKQVLSEKISRRIHAVRAVEDLYTIVPKELLPEEYGGKEKPLEELNTDLLKELGSEKHIEYLKIMFKAGTDESKRHVGKFNDEYMGMPGSFRNLSVD